MLAVKVTARLIPPEMIGISMASVRSPSSGNWNATELKVASDRKRGDSEPKNAITATSASTRPMFSAPSFARRPQPAGLPWRRRRRQASVMRALPAAAGQHLAERRVGQGDRNQDDRADDHLECIRRNAEQVEPVLRHRDEEHAEDAAEHGAASAAEARSAEDHGRQHIELAPDQRVGHHLLRVVHLHQPANARHQPEPAEGDEMHGRDVDAEPPCALGIVAEGIELTPGGGMPDQHPGGDDADRHDRHR